MKKILILILITLILLLSSCSPGTAILYENEFDEMDIGGRINTCAYDIKFSRSRYIMGKLGSIRRDLLSIKATDQFLIGLNQQFMQCVSLLEQAADAYEREDISSADVFRESARKLYISSDRQLNKYKRI